MKKHRYNVFGRGLSHTDEPSRKQPVTPGRVQRTAGGHVTSRASFFTCVSLRHRLPFMNEGNPAHLRPSTHHQGTDSEKRKRVTQKSRVRNMATNPSLIITEVLKAADRMRRSSDHTNPAHRTHAYSESVGNPEPYGELIQPMCVCVGGLFVEELPPLPVYRLCSHSGQNCRSQGRPRAGEERLNPTLLI